MNNCSQGGAVECDTVQIIEPKSDFLVDSGGVSSDMDERGTVELSSGQTRVDVTFLVPKLSINYNFEYLYVEAIGNTNPGAIQIVPVTKSAQGFTVVLAGAPIGAGYVLHWRVTIVTTSSIIQIDAPENIYLQLPRDGVLDVVFTNPRSDVDYGFTELTVENLIDALNLTPIQILVINKSTSGFTVAFTPHPPTDNYFLRIRTP